MATAALPTWEELQKLPPEEQERFLLELEELKRLEERVRAGRHPAHLLEHMECWDQRRVADSGSGAFRFNMNPPAGTWDWRKPDQRFEPWSWQRQLIDTLFESQRMIVLKARQLGVTWLGCGYGVWVSLYRPGSLSLFYRQKEADAKELVERAAVQVRSLPPHLLNGAEVRVSKQGIEFLFPDGKKSQILAQSSADASGMGKTAAFVLLDEFAWVENPPAIMKSVSSAAGQEGKIFIVSTANGVYNELTGAGNYFHYLWSKADEIGLATLFLPYWFHPDRDEEWEKSPEILNLREWERKEQYPSTPEEAFEITDACWFDKSALYWYAQRIPEPLYRGRFELRKTGLARLVKDPKGWITVFREPEADHQYAIGADVATGHGLDFSAAYVIDLQDMAFCAEFHGKLDTDEFAEQLHYLGRWYNTALIAVEDAGGFGNATIIALRDGREGRPAYPRLYRHRQFVRPDQLEHKQFGFPMNKATRAPVLEYLEEALREHALAWLTPKLHSEMGTFVRFDPRTGKSPTGTWPRAMEGCNDDLVMAAAIACEMYRQRGEHPRKPKPKTRPYRRDYVWS